MSVSAASDTTEIVAKALGQIGDIATLPEITVKIIEVVEDPNSSARDLHQIIKNDPALSARILKVVNSAFYGLPGQIATVDRAIVMLGLSAVKNIAIAASIAKLFRGSKLGGKFSPLDLWKHSIAVGTASRMMIKMLGRQGGEEIFVAGLIHDLGLLIERQVFDEQLAEVIARAEGGEDFCALERQLMGADHQDFGLGLTTKWKFPRHLRVVTGYHHNPDRLQAEVQELATVVFLADKICCSQKVGLHIIGGDDPIPPEALELLKLTEQQIEQLVVELPAQLEVAELMLSSA